VEVGPRPASPIVVPVIPKNAWLENDPDVQPPKPNPTSHAGAALWKRSKETPPSGLNPRYLLDRFVVGECNRLAHSASLSVVEKLALAYNPLVFYGGTGLGKTHLLHGICHAIHEKAPDCRVVYLSCEQFVNEFIRSLREGMVEAFRARFRNADLLAIDDVQFLVSKDRSEVEFCHTFDALWHMGKQIVLTLDSHPKEIPGLRGKLSTRLISGLVVNLEAPDEISRRTILASKLTYRGLAAPPEVLDLLAARIDGNVRELEGAVLKLSALADAEGKAIDLSLAEAVLQRLSPKRIGPLSSEEICQVVAKHYGVPLTEIRSQRREKRVLVPRQMAMYLIRTLTDASYGTIGAYFGGRNHATALHSVRKIRDAQADNPFMAETLKLLRIRLRT
jgi:chromosomal replication initiator protein